MPSDESYAFYSSSFFSLQPESLISFNNLLPKEVLRPAFHLNVYDPGVLMNPYKVPFLNTVILLTSGAVLTVSHIYLRIEKFLYSVLALFLTILLACFFIFCQVYEYLHSGFSINDGIFGSTFYMLTGFHGFHVIVGTCFLIVCLIRFLLQHYTRTDHLSYECAI